MYLCIINNNNITDYQVVYEIQINFVFYKFSLYFLFLAVCCMIIFFCLTFASTRWGYTCPTSQSNSISYPLFIHTIFLHITF